MSRIVSLYGRCRNVPWTLMGLLLLSAASWVAAEWLAALGPVWHPQSRVPVIAAAPLLAATLIGGTLHSPDVDLDHATPTNFALLRLGQVLSSTALCVGLLALIALRAANTFGSAALVRNAVGYIGISCLAAVFLGAAVAWLPGLIVGLTLYLTAPTVPAGIDSWWAWTMQDGRWDGSWVVAATLCVAGVAFYAYRGPRRTDVS